MYTIVPMPMCMHANKVIKRSNQKEMAKQKNNQTNEDENNLPNDNLDFNDAPLMHLKNPLCSEFMILSELQNQ